MFKKIIGFCSVLVVSLFLSSFFVESAFADADAISGSATDSICTAITGGSCSNTCGISELDAGDSYCIKTVVSFSSTTKFTMNSDYYDGNTPKRTGPASSPLTTKSNNQSATNVDKTVGSHNSLSGGGKTYHYYPTVSYTIKKYFVTYNINGGVGNIPADSNTYAVGTAVKALDGTGFSSTTATFGGWNTVSNGSGTSVVAGANINMISGGLTLFAQWTTNPTLTYDKNGASGINFSESRTSGVSASLKTISTLGFSSLTANFVGWATTSKGVASYTDGVLYRMPNVSTTLYAIWATNTYKVTYTVGNCPSCSGSAPVDNNNYVYGTTVNVLSGSSLSRNDGYTFSGWYTIDTGIVNFYGDGGANIFLMPTNNVTLTALWVATPHVLTYYANGAQGIVPDSVLIITDVPTIIAKQGELKSSGLCFNGWSTTSSGPVTYYPDENVSFSENTDLYAKWSATVGSTNCSLAPNISLGITQNYPSKIASSTGTTSLSWSVSNASTCHVDNNGGDTSWYGYISAGDFNNSATVGHITSDTIYSMTCYGMDRITSTTATTTVHVNSSVPIIDFSASTTCYAAVGSSNTKTDKVYVGKEMEWYIAPNVPATETRHKYHIEYTLSPPSYTGKVDFDLMRGDDAFVIKDTYSTVGTKNLSVTLTDTVNGNSSTCRRSVIAVPNNGGVIER